MDSETEGMGPFTSALTTLLRTALMLACENGSVETVEVLVNAGARVAVVDSTGHDATHYSLATGNALIQHFLQEAAPRQSWASGKAAMPSWCSLSTGDGPTGVFSPCRVLWGRAVSNPWLEEAEQGLGAYVPFSHALGVPSPMLLPAKGWEVVLSLGCLSVSAHACVYMFTHVNKHGGISACVYQPVCLYMSVCGCLRACASPCPHMGVHPCDYTSMYIPIFVCLRVCLICTCGPWARVCVFVPLECPPLYEHMQGCPCTHVGSACCAHPHDPLNLLNFSFFLLCPTEEESTEQTSQVRACLSAHLSSGLAWPQLLGWGIPRSPGALQGGDGSGRRKATLYVMSSLPSCLCRRLHPASYPSGRRAAPQGRGKPLCLPWAPPAK